MKRGWCPGLHDPMPTGDGLLVRVKPPGARLTGTAARCLAQASRRFGNGTMELTSRGNIQVRGLDAAGVPRFAAAMEAAGLASAEAGAERRRNVMLHPLAGDDPAAAADAGPLAAAIEAMLEADPALAALPPKFGFAVDGGGVLGRCGSADITVRTDGARHWIGLDGAEAPCAPDATVGLLHALARAAGPRRARGIGAALMTVVGLVPSAPVVHASTATPAGFIAYPGTDHGAFALGLPFGQTDGAMLDLLAELAERFSGGVLRLSPWRAVLLGRVGTGDAPALRAAAGSAGLIVEAGDRRLRMAACIGSDGCASGTVPARRDAALLAAAGWSGFLHVSGCAKGCAHPGRAANTLVGGGGSYSAVRDGRADAPPVAAGLSPAQAAAWLGAGR